MATSLQTKPSQSAARTRIRQPKLFHDDPDLAGKTLRGQKAASTKRIMGLISPSLPDPLDNGKWEKLRRWLLIDLKIDEELKRRRRERSPGGTVIVPVQGWRGRREISTSAPGITGAHDGPSGINNTSDLLAIEASVTVVPLDPKDASSPSASIYHSNAYAPPHISYSESTGGSNPCSIPRTWYDYNGISYDTMSYPRRLPHSVFNEYGLARSIPDGEHQLDLLYPDAM